MTDAADGAAADAAANDAQDKGGDAAKAGDAGRTFSQADVDRIVQERVARAKSTPPDDYEEFKAAATKLAEIETANKTELEKANERATKAEADAKAATDRAKETSLRAAIIAEAAKKNVIDPDAVVALLDKSAIEFDADGSPTNIAEAMDSLLKAKSYLVGGGSRGDADQGARGGNGANQLSRDALDNMSPDQVTKALNEGRFDTLLRGA